MMETKKRTECSICLCVYKDPYILRCNHTFCKECIKGLRPKRRVQCPLCNSFCDVNAIKPNYALREALQDIEEADIHLIELTKLLNLLVPENAGCELCSKRIVDFRCIDCSQWICVECKDIHTKIKTANKHRIESLSDCNSETNDILNRETKTLKGFVQQYQENVRPLDTEIASVRRIKILTLEKSAEIYKEIIDEIRTRFNTVDSQITTICEDKIKDLQLIYQKQIQYIEFLSRYIREIENTIQEHSEDLAIAGERISAEVPQLTKSHVPDKCLVMPFSLQVSVEPTWKIDDIAVINQSGGDVTITKAGVSVAPTKKPDEKAVINKSEGEVTSTEAEVSVAPTKKLDDMDVIKQSGCEDTSTKAEKLDDMDVINQSGAEVTRTKARSGREVIGIVAALSWLSLVICVEAIFTPAWVSTTLNLDRIAVTLDCRYFVAEEGWYNGLVQVVLTDCINTFFVTGFDKLWFVGSLLMLANAIYTTILYSRPRPTNMCNIYNVIIVFLAVGILTVSCVSYFVHHITYSFNARFLSTNNAVIPSQPPNFNWGSYMAICGAAAGLLTLKFTIVEVCGNMRKTSQRS